MKPPRRNLRSEAVRAPGASVRSITLTMSFDDGRAIARMPSAPASTPSLPAEYDVAACNPRLDAELYTDLGPAPVPPASGQEPARVKLPAAPPPPTAARPPSERAEEVEATAPRSGTGAALSRRLKSLVKDEELQADIDAILTGRSSSAPPQPAPARPQPAPRQPSPPPTSQAASAAAAAAAEQGNEHRIFERIAENMRFATAYDLGSVELGHRFDRFDQLEAQQRAKTAAQRRPERRAPFAPPSSATLSTAGRGAPSTGLDPNDTQTQREHLDDPAWPPPPNALRAYAHEELRALFGSLEHEPDPQSPDGDGIRILGSWIADNIVSVPIPQLQGKLHAGEPMKAGAMLFHRVGAQALANLWREWEEAGLLQHVISFHGAFAPRHAPRTRGQSPRPLGTRAWGIGFDINAEWNPPGQQPALPGRTGSVRELVEIANRHGFLWGGHSKTEPEGMHFELAMRV